LWGAKSVPFNSCSSRSELLKSRLTFTNSPRPATLVGDGPNLQSEYVTTAVWPFA